MTSGIISTLDSLREPLTNSQFLSPEEKSGIEVRVQSLAEHVLSDSTLPQDEKEEALQRIKLSTPNTTLHIRYGTLFSANLIRPLSSPAEESTPYPDELQVPFISSYGGGPNHKFIVRLDPVDCQHILPKGVKDAIGDRIPTENIDLFLLHEGEQIYGFEEISGKYSGKKFQQPSSELLVKFHTWLYPDLPVGSDIAIDPLMGVFPDFGITTAQYKPISVGSLSTQRVHAHPDKHDKKYMLYSPNNAHIAVDQSAPFCATWVVAEHEHRACAAKILFPSKGIDDDVHGIFKDFFELHTHCESAAEYTEKLESIKESLQKFLTVVFSPLQEFADAGNVEEMQRTLGSIPPSFADKIVDEFQKMAPSKNPKASFFAASKELQLESLRRASDAILYCLIDEQIALIKAVRPAMIARQEHPATLPLALVIRSNLSSKDTVHLLGDGPGMHEWEKPFLSFREKTTEDIIEINLPYSEREYEFKLVKVDNKGKQTWQTIQGKKQKNKRSTDSDVRSGIVVVDFPRNK